MTTPKNISNISFIIYVILFCLIPINNFAQQNERRIFLWDVSGSLCPPKGGKTLGGFALPPIKGGNGLFVDLQKALIGAIDWIEEDPRNTIVLVPFQEYPLAVKEVKANKAGKEFLKRYITNFKYHNHRYTSIVNAMNKFKNLCRSNCINYMFLYTDGKDDNPPTKQIFPRPISEWNSANYGFYVIVHKDADIRPIKTPANFWFVNDAKVNINVCSLPRVISYNIKDDRKRTVSLSGHTSKVSSDCRIKFDVKDPYYKIKVIDDKVCDGRISFSLIKKGNPPVKHLLKIHLSKVGGDPYTFIAPEVVTVNCINKRERSLKISIE
jgi:hypothetical protein